MVSAGAFPFHNVCTIAFYSHLLTFPFIVRVTVFCRALVLPSFIAGCNRRQFRAVISCTQQPAMYAPTMAINAAAPVSACLKTCPFYLLAPLTP